MTAFPIAEQWVKQYGRKPVAGVQFMAMPMIDSAFALPFKKYSTLKCRPVFDQAIIEFPVAENKTAHIGMLIQKIEYTKLRDLGLMTVGPLTLVPVGDCSHFTCHLVAKHHGVIKVIPRGTIWSFSNETGCLAQFYGPTDEWFAANKDNNSQEFEQPPPDQMIPQHFRGEARTIFFDIKTGKYTAGPKQDEENDSTITSMMRQALFALALCHVDNIEVDSENFDEPVKRRLAKKGAPIDMMIVRTLKIVPFAVRSVKPADPRPNEYGQVMQHLVRGHFSTYTAEKPLLGKYVGTFWIPQHVRGNAAYGRVEKQYDVDITDV